MTALCARCAGAVLGGAHIKRKRESANTLGWLGFRCLRRARWRGGGSGQLVHFECANGLMMNGVESIECDIQLE